MAENRVNSMAFAEAQYISKILTSGESTLATDYGIPQSYFVSYSKEYDFIYDHIRKYHIPPDVLTFKGKFTTFPLMDTVKEPDAYLVDALIKATQTRAISEKFNKIRDALMNDDLDTALQIDQNPVDIDLSDYLTSVPDILSPEEAQVRLDEYVDKMQNFDSYYIPTGFKELDINLGGGWDRKEEFATFVARPGVGKSWMLDITAVAASERGMRVGLYSGEMSKNKVGYRIDTIRSHISNFAISHGRRDIQTEYRKYVGSCADTTQGPIFLATIKDDFSGNTPTIRDFETFIKKYKLDILLVDQQSLMEDIGHSKNAVDKAGNIAKELKLLQTTMKIPVITVCQQNRSGEDNKKDKNGNKFEIEYDVSRIAGSDKVGQYSTIVIFLEYDRNTRILKLIPAKTRDGSSMPISYAWDIDKGVFTHLSVEDSTPESEEECNNLHNEFEGNNDDVVF